MDICAREPHGPQPSSDSPFLLGQVLIFLMIPFLGFPRAAISLQHTGLTQKQDSPHAVAQPQASSGSMARGARTTLRKCQMTP